MLTLMIDLCIKPVTDMGKSTWHVMLMPCKHAIRCQYRACTGPMLQHRTSTGPVMAHNGIFMGRIPVVMNVSANTTAACQKNAQRILAPPICITHARSTTSHGKSTLLRHFRVTD